jgi:hypothetical protein
MKLFGFFGKSSDDDQGTSTEDSIPSESSEAADEPQQAPEPQSEAAVDRGATMSDVIKAVTDQFALINADSDADLRAGGCRAVPDSRGYVAIVGRIFVFSA